MIRLVLSFCFTVAIVLGQEWCHGSVSANDESAEVRSDLKIDYSDWASVLRETVMRTGRSDRKPAPKVRATIGTNISRANPNPSRLEANRVLYHALDDKNLAYLGRMRASLSELHEQPVFDQLSRNEQLAYWLNLHNIIVFHELAKRYPITNLEPFYVEVWSEPVVMLQGRMQSLSELERYVVRNWKNPLVIYGFYSGNIGSPNLRRSPFDGKTVWVDLEANAKDFVNSLRGLQFDRDTARVSVLYDRLQPLFDDFQKDMKKHLMAYATPEVQGRLADVAHVTTDVTDWYVADLYNGHLGPGTAVNTNPANLLLGAADKAEFFYARLPALTKYPPHVRDFLVDLNERNRKTREANVSVEEYVEDRSGGEKEQPKE